MRQDDLSAEKEGVFSLRGEKCSCTVEGSDLSISGRYFRYAGHERHPYSGSVRIPLKGVMRIGMTKTYSRRMFLVPVVCGALAVLIKSIPSLSFSPLGQTPVLSDLTSVTFWSVPGQDFLWHLFAVLFVLTLPLNWISNRKYVEVNAVCGRFLFSDAGMTKEQIFLFEQRAASRKEHVLTH